jgi:DNA-binding PadR family transcriptional regulator
MGSEQAGLTPAVFHVLLALERGALHGYGIMQAVAETAGVSMGPGTIYGTLQRLSDAGLVDEADSRPGEAGERRRCYRLTRAGRDALKAEARRIAELAELLRTRRLAPSQARVR